MTARESVEEGREEQIVGKDVARFWRRGDACVPHTQTDRQTDRQTDTHRVRKREMRRGLNHGGVLVERATDRNEGEIEGSRRRMRVCYTWIYPFPWRMGSERT